MKKHIEIISSQPFTLPILRKEENGNYSQCGTGTLILFSGKCYILTAAHVRDDLGKGPIVTLIDKKYYGINGYFLCTPFNGNRDNDPIDMGLVELPEMIIEKLNGKYTFFDESMMATSIKTIESIITVEGFPGNKNPQNANKSIMNCHCSRVKTSEIPEKLSKDKIFTNTLNIALDFDRRHVKDLSGRDITHPETKGMSGGAVTVETENGFILVGILTKELSDKKIFLATRASVLLNTLELYAQNGALQKLSNMNRELITNKQN